VTLVDATVPLAERQVCCTCWPDGRRRVERALRRRPAAVARCCPRAAFRRARRRVVLRRPSRR
jgi:hypothetical protein